MDIKNKLNQIRDFISVNSSKLRRWITTDTGTKLAIFGFTIILWFFIILGNRFTYTFRVPLEVHNIEEGKTLKQRLPSRIEASFSGRGIDLLYLMFSRRASFKLVVDLQNIRWFYNFPLNEYFQRNPEKIITPRVTNVSFSEVVSPDTLFVELDILTTKTVPVVADLQIEMAPGYLQAADLQVLPDSIILSGPRYYVSHYKRVVTEPIRLRNQSSDINREVSLKIAESENIILSHSRVRVIQPVEQIGEKSIPNVPVEIIGAEPGAQIESVPPQVSLRVVAGVSQLKQLQPNDFSVQFDYRQQWRKGQQYYTPVVRLPDYVIRLESMKPKQIEVRVYRERR